MKLIKLKKVILLILFLIIALVIVKIPNINELNLNIFTGNTLVDTERGSRQGNLIKILEIEPGDIFKLTNTNGKSIDPGDWDDNKIIIPKNERIYDQVNGSYVEITHITMPEFVSMIDEINGKYDIVVIGRENIKFRGQNYWDEIKGLSSEYNYNTKYIDYTNPFSTKLEKLTFPNVYNEVEYYSENDLTEKRMKEFENIIKSGQLIYIDNKISKDNYFETISWKIQDKTIKNTNLYSLYNSYNKDNFKKVDFDNISLEKIVSEYKKLSNNLKRPCITEEENIVANIDSNMNIKFNFNIDDKVNSNIKVKLYLDRNGDGLFTEDEYKSDIVSSITNNVYNSKNCEVSYRLNDNLWGYLGWKIEVIKDINNDIEIKTNIIGSNVINRPQNIPKTQIKVLQLFPSYWNSYSENDKPKELKYNPIFENLCNEISEDYSIDIVRKRIDYFDKEIVDGSEQLNGKYNVVIIGFGKNDTVGSYNDKLSSKTIEEIKNYIKSGQSIIFTSDTMSYTIPSVEDKKSTLTQSFRDIIGQARFKDPFNQDEYDVYGKKINHMNLREQEGKYSAGMTVRTWTGVGENSSDNKYYVRNINKSKLTSYPFNLNGKNLEVSKYDRVQVYQLNLEDEDIVPSYNIINDGNGAINNGDSRNFYYSYSKGNITYCASLPNFNAPNPENKFPEDELKFFINTIINSQSNSNNKPAIKSNYLNNEILDNEIINLQSISEDFYFTTKAMDSDGDKVKLEVKLDGEENDYITSNGFEAQGTIIPVNIPSSKLKEVFLRANKNLNIKIIAEDEKGAKSEASYTIDLSQAIDITHGLYEGIENMKVNIIDISNKVFANDSIVTLASNLNNISEYQHRYINLKIDDNIIVADNTKTIIYFFKDGELKGKSEMQKEGREFTYKIENSYDTIAIVYSVKLNKTQYDYINTVSVLNSNKEEILSEEAIIKIVDDKDLF